MKRTTITLVRAVATAACLLFAGATPNPLMAAFENDVPHEAKGYRKSGYDLSQYETINLANGNLTFRVPLYTISTDGGLSYDLALYYNAKVWFTAQRCPITPDGYNCSIGGEIVPMSKAEVADGIPNVGFGWDVRPPRVLFSRRESDYLPPPVYVDSSGARHMLYAHEAWEEVPAGGGASCNTEVGGVCFTRDGSNLRFTVQSVGQSWDPADPRPVPTEVVMDDGSGTQYVFSHVVPVSCNVDSSLPLNAENIDQWNFHNEVAGLYLSEIRTGPWPANAAANRIRVEYLSEPDGWASECTTATEPWLPSKIEAVDASDQRVRGVDFSYTSQYFGGADHTVLNSITTPFFDSDSGGTISLSYQAARYQQQLYPSQSYPAVAFFEAPTLVGVTYPESMSFQFNTTVTPPESYDIAWGSPLWDVVLPSGATVAYHRETEQPREVSGGVTPLGTWPAGLAKTTNALGCTTLISLTEDGTQEMTHAIEIPADGGEARFFLRTVYCSWDAAVAVGSSWIRLTSPLPPRGGVIMDGDEPQEIRFEVLPNTGPAREGRIDIVGAYLRILQCPGDGSGPSIGCGGSREPEAEGFMVVGCGTSISVSDVETYWTESLLHEGVAYRKITYRDASGERTETTRFHSWLNCSGTSYRPSFGGTWPYDLAYALRDSTGAVSSPEYLWTYVFTTESGDGPGIGEIHRFHPETGEEFSVDRFEIDDPEGLWFENFAAYDASEDFSTWEILYGLRRKRHVEIEREVKTLTPNPNPFGQPFWSAQDRYRYVKARRTESAPVVDDENPTGAFGGCSETVPLPYDPLTAAIPTCPRVIETFEVDQYLNPTKHITTTANMPFPELDVDKEIRRDFDPNEAAWYLHRQTAEYVGEPGCEDTQPGLPCDGDTRTTWSPLESSPWFSRPTRRVTNPDASGACTDDCVQEDYLYDDQAEVAGAAGNLRDTKVSGGSGPFSDGGFGAFSVTTRTTWAHGRPQKKEVVASDGSNLPLWERDIDAATGLTRWHLDGSGTGFGYDYDALGRMTAIVPLQAQKAEPSSPWGNFALQGATDPVTGEEKHLLGMTVDYAPPATDGSTLLTHTVSDAAFLVTPDEGFSLVAGSTHMREKYIFDGRGRLTQTVEALPDTLTEINRVRSRFDLDFFTGAGDGCDSSAFGSPASYVKTRVQLASEWIMGQAWPGCSNLPRAETHFDQLGRPAAARAPDGSLVFTAYDGDFITRSVRSVATGVSGGSVIQEALPREQLTDPLGRVRWIRETVALDATNGDTVAVSRFEYDHLDRLRKVLLDPLGGTADPDTVSAASRSFDYWGAGFLKQSSEPERTQVLGAYDAAGNLRYQSAPTQVVLSYDSFSRPIGRTVNGIQTSTSDWGPSLGQPSYNRVVGSTQLNRFPDGDNVLVERSWEYDGPGSRVSAASTAVAGLGTAGDAFRVRYGYDEWGNVSTVGYPRWHAQGDSVGCRLSDWEGLEFLYDGPWQQEVGRLLTSGAYESIGYAEYGPTGRVNRLEYGYSPGAGPVAVQLEVPDTWGMARPWQYTLENGLGQTLSQGTFGPYGYDGSGNIWKIAEKRYAYDGLGRLTRFWLNSGSTLAESYGYDRWGNMTSLTRGARTWTYEMQELPDLVDPIPSTNRLATVSDGGSAQTVTYDSRGNLEWMPAFYGQRAKHFEFDAEDRLVESTDTASGSRWRYAYDAAGERVASWTGSGDELQTRLFLRDEGGKLLSEWTTVRDPGLGLDLRNDYVPALGRVLAEIEPISGGESLRYLVADHLGSTRVVLAADGSVLETLDYYPFGDDRVGGPTFEAAHLFTGHERDQGTDSTELDYMHARYYSSNLGRFLSVDPVGGEVGSSQSWNRYSYALNRPTRIIDLDGRANLDGLSRMNLTRDMSASQVDALNQAEADFARRAAPVTVPITAAGLGFCAAVALPELYSLGVATLYSRPDLAVTAVEAMAPGAESLAPVAQGTSITKNAVIEGFTVSNHAWRKGGLGKGATVELVSSVIRSAEEAGTVVEEVSKAAKFEGNTIKQYTHEGVTVVVDATRKVIMSIKNVDARKFKVE